MVTEKRVVDKTTADKKSRPGVSSDRAAAKNSAAEKKAAKKTATRRTRAKKMTAGEKRELARKQEVAQICIGRLKELYPDTTTTLTFENAWQLLISLRLAAQC